MRSGVALARPEAQEARKRRIHIPGRCDRHLALRSPPGSRADALSARAKPPPPPAACPAPSCALENAVLIAVAARPVPLDDRVPVVRSAGAAPIRFVPSRGADGTLRGEAFPKSV